MAVVQVVAVLVAAAAAAGEFFRATDGLKKKRVTRHSYFLTFRVLRQNTSGAKLSCPGKKFLIFSGEQIYGEVFSSDNILNKSAFYWLL